MTSLIPLRFPIPSVLVLCHLLRLLLFFYYLLQLALPPYPLFFFLLLILHIPSPHIPPSSSLLSFRLPSLPPPPPLPPLTSLRFYSPSFSPSLSSSFYSCYFYPLLLLLFQLTHSSPFATPHWMPEGNCKAPNQIGQSPSSVPCLLPLKYPLPSLHSFLQQTPYFPHRNQTWHSAWLLSVSGVLVSLRGQEDDRQSVAETDRRRRGHWIPSPPPRRLSTHLLSSYPEIRIVGCRVENWFISKSFPFAWGPFGASVIWSWLRMTSPDDIIKQMTPLGDVVNCIIREQVACFQGARGNGNNRSFSQSQFSTHTFKNIFVYLWNSRNQ